MKPENFELLPVLLDLFYKHGGYWDINHSEDKNLEIRWAPFVGKESGGFCEEVFRKRVYCLKDFYNLCAETINQHLKEKESLI